MYTQQQVDEIVRRFCGGVRTLFPQDRVEAILFGSYARGDAETGSDIDVLILVDAPRQKISELSWQVGDLAADFLVNDGIVVSPVVENRAYYAANADILPYFRSIRREGVRLRA